MYHIFPIYIEVTCLVLITTITIFLIFQGNLHIQVINWTVIRNESGSYIHNVLNCKFLSILISLDNLEINKNKKYIFIKVSSHS